MNCLKPLNLVAVAFLLSSVPETQAVTVRIQPKNQSSIQKAIHRLPPEGGEIVLLPRDEPILIKSSIVIDRNNVTLRGEGKVVLRLAKGANAPVIIMGQSLQRPMATLTNIHVRNLVIDGNRLQQTSELNTLNPELRNNGISLRRITDSSVEGVTAFACRSGGLVTELGCRRLLVKDFESYDNHFDGVACYETEDSLFTSMKLHNNEAAGISLDIAFVRNVISDSLLSSNRSVGIFMRDSRDNVFSNVKILSSADHGVFVAQADNDLRTSATGNKFKGCIITNSGGAGVRVNDASCVNNFLTATQLLNNAGGAISESATGLLHPEELVVK